MRRHSRSALASLMAAGVMLVLILGAHRVLSAQAAQAPLASNPAEACDQCKDLCRLMDRYLEREKGIELWKNYTYKNRKNIPSSVKDMVDIENHVVERFDE